MFSFGRVRLSCFCSLCFGFQRDVRVVGKLRLDMNLSAREQGTMGSSGLIPLAGDQRALGRSVRGGVEGACLDFTPQIQLR